MNLYALLYNLSRGLLTIGASLILGFLSVGGLYAFWPSLPFAALAFTLSVAYESEIYWQNITSALNKFTPGHVEHQLGNTYLLANFPAGPAHGVKDTRPQFFIDYEAQLRLIHHINHIGEHQPLNAAALARKKREEAVLHDMEKWFARVLFPKSNHVPSAEQLEIHNWITQNAELNNQQEQLNWKEQLDARLFQFNVAYYFSATAALFMGLGTTYLLMESIAILPFVIAPALLAPIVVIAAGIAGLSYGFLTYNSITDMIDNDTLQQWSDKILECWNGGATLPNIIVIITASVLIPLAAGLTFCTAGTWWTITKNTPALFDWIANLPSFVMGFINPIITGISSLAFNVSNSLTSLNSIVNLFEKAEEHLNNMDVAIREYFTNLYNNEHWLQWINPFRLLVALTYIPLRAILFLGHLVSIALVANRVSGISQETSAGLGFFSELFEDWHYFAPHSHTHGHTIQDLLKTRFRQECGHNHDLDIPTRLLQIPFYPLNYIAAAWDNYASYLGPVPIDFNEAWAKQMGKETDIVEDQVISPAKHALYCVQGIKENHLNNQVAVDALNELEQNLRAIAPGEGMAAVTNFFIIQAQVAIPNIANNSHFSFFAPAPSPYDELNEAVDRIYPTTAA